MKSLLITAYSILAAVQEQYLYAAVTPTVDGKSNNEIWGVDYARKES